MEKLLKAISSIELKDFLRLVTIAVALLLASMSLGSWKKGLEDRQDQQANVIKEQGQAIRSLSNALAQSMDQENEKLEKVQNSVTSMYEKLGLVEQWAKMAAANSRP